MGVDIFGQGDLLELYIHLGFSTEKVRPDVVNRSEHLPGTAIYQ